MMGVIITLLVRWGLKETLAKRLAPLATIAAAIALLAALWGAYLIYDWFDDRAAVQADRIKREAAEAKLALERERAASEAAAKREAARSAASAATKERLKEIEDEDPAAAVAPAPAGSRAVADRLRRDGGGRRGQHPEPRSIRTRAGDRPAR